MSHPTLARKRELKHALRQIRKQQQVLSKHEAHYKNLLEQIKSGKNVTHRKPTARRYSKKQPILSASSSSSSSREEGESSSSSSSSSSDNDHDDNEQDDTYNNVNESNDEEEEEEQEDVNEQYREECTDTSDFACDESMPYHQSDRIRIDGPICITIKMGGGGGGSHANNSRKKPRYT